MPKAKKGFVTYLLVWVSLSSCTSATPSPSPRTLTSLSIEYRDNIEHAQNSISHASCLRSLELDDLNPSEIYDGFLLSDISNYAELVLDGATRQSTAPPNRYRVYPSFKQYVAEAREIIDQLSQLEGQGDIHLEFTTALSSRIYRHAQPISDWIRTGKMGEERGTIKYLIPAYDPENTVTTLAHAISSNALRASYLSDSESYQAIYECSNINGTYDRRFSGTENLTFDDAKAVVDFASMTSREREASGKEKRIERARRIEDAIDTIKALEKIF